MWDNDQVRRFSDTLFRDITEFWLSQNRVDFDPLAFVFMTHDGKDDCVFLPQASMVPKSWLPGMLRRFAAEHDARYVALAASATVVDTVDPVAMKAWYASGKKLSEHPQAKDCIILTVDGAGLSVCMRAWWSDGRLHQEVLDNHGAEGILSNLSGRLGEN